MRYALVSLMVLAACARPPQRIAGDFPPISPGDVREDRYVGEHVRWGGIIVENYPREDETCLEVVGLPLDRRARPRLVDETLGRFRGCVPGYYEPEVYGPQREVTIVGTVQGVERGMIGEQAYEFPRVAAESVYLWPERPRYDSGVSYGVGFGFGGPWYGWGSDVVVIDRGWERPAGPMTHTRPRR